MTTPAGSKNDQFDGSGNLILVVMISLLLATGSVILVIAEAQDEPEIPAARPDVGPDHRGLDEGSGGEVVVATVPTEGVVDESADRSPPETPTPDPSVSADEPQAPLEPVAAPEEVESTPEAESTEVPSEPSISSSVKVVESDRVNIGRALGGNVEFVPTNAFDVLADEIRDPTFAVSVEIRSRVVKAGSRVTVHATGVWVRITDTVRHVRLPAIKVEFIEGPFPRRINRDDPSRPRLEPFNTALRLDSKTYVRRVEAAVRKALVAAKAKRNN